VEKEPAKAPAIRGTVAGQSPAVSSAGADCKWAVTDEGKEVLRKLRDNHADFTSLHLVRETSALSITMCSMDSVSI
jgi:hypothetical protein